MSYNNTNTEASLMSESEIRIESDRTRNALLGLLWFAIFFLSWYLAAQFYFAGNALISFLFLTLLVISVKYTYTYFHQAIVKTPIVIFTPEGLKIPRTFHKPLVWDYPGISDITVLEKNDHTMQMLITGKEVTHPSGHQYFGLNYPFSKAMTKETRNRLEEAAKRYKLKLSFRKAE